MGIDGSIRLNGFFKCPCGKLHTHGGLNRSSLCPECSRELWPVAMADNTPLTPGEFHRRLGVTPETDRLIEALAGVWSRKNREPRTACPYCSFEFTELERLVHTC